MRYQPVEDLFNSGGIIPSAYVLQGNVPVRNLKPLPYGRCSTSIEWAGDIGRIILRASEHKVCLHYEMQATD